MNVLNDITDVEFIPFLNNLGVETHNKSFEWILNYRDFSGVLQWLYHNLDHSNALTAREEYRYAEIVKHGHLLSVDDLNAKIADLKNEYSGLVLPGDKESQKNVECNIDMYKERLHMLEAQEQILNDLLKQNERTYQALKKEIFKLNSAEQQCREDESRLAEECLTLAEEVENATEDVIAVVGDILNMYSSCNTDEEVSRKFFTYGPFDSYKQTQALFRSHFDLYSSKKFSSRHMDNVTDEDLNTALVEAMNMEDRLTDALLAYVDSKSELAGEQAKVALAANLTPIHPSQIASCSMEVQSAWELLKQEEMILKQQVQVEAEAFVKERTRLAVEVTSRFALAVREQIFNDISYLLESTQKAVALDRLVYFALRCEVNKLEEFVQFAIHIKHYAESEKTAITNRIDSMNQICAEQESCERKLQSTDLLVETLRQILDVESSEAKAGSDLVDANAELKEAVEDAFEKAEAALNEFKRNQQPLRDCVFNGQTHRANSGQVTAALLAHSLAQKIANTDKRAVEVGGLFTSTKNGDKHHLRKLWQWFITDPIKLTTVIKGVPLLEACRVKKS